jgi:RNA ligase
MHIYDVFDSTVLGDLIAEGWVKEQFHPTEPLAILNYTDKAQLASANELWNHPYYGESIRQCRGLIYRIDNGTVIATPWPKFFNHGQGGAAEIALDEKVIVTDKVDGSLGILYRRPSDGYLAIATRGSFTSEQALHATQLFREKYDGFTPDPGDTILFEIIYPENRIVLDYGSEDDLILLGAVDIEYGWISTPDDAARNNHWEGPRAKTFVYTTLAEALANMTRENAEGYVVMSDSGFGSEDRRMIKLKQEDYKALHAAIFGLNQRSVYNAIMVGLRGPDEQYGDTTLDRLLEALPDELHDWVKMQARQLKARVTEPAERIRKEYARISNAIDWPEEGVDYYEWKRQCKKTFAQFVKGDKYAWAFFLLYDGRGDQIEMKLWQKLEPDGRINPASDRVDENCKAVGGTFRCPGCIYCPRDDEGD